MIKYFDAQQWLRERQPKRAKFLAVLVAIFVTLLTSAVAGLCFTNRQYNRQMYSSAGEFSCNLFNTVVLLCALVIGR